MRWLLVVRCCNENNSLIVFFLPLVRTRIASAVFSSCQTLRVHCFRGAVTERGLSAGSGVYWLNIFTI